MTPVPPSPPRAAAFDDGAWPATPVGERAALLDRIADLLQRDKESLASLETGTPARRWSESRIDIDDVTSVFRYYARLVGVESDRLVDVGDPAVISRVVREPIGVCVLIAPWNYPLLQMSWKIAPALGRGLHDGRQAQRGHAADHHRVRRTCSTRRGCPPSVVNLVQGSGAVLGAALTDNPDVDFISFTGGLATGRTICEGRRRTRHQGRGRTRRQEPAHRVRRRGLRDSAVDHVLTGVFLHSGQVCSAGTRLIVEESIADDFVAELAARAEKIRIGDGMDPASETGPLVSEQHRAKVEAHVQQGISEGAKLVTGGARPTDPALAEGQLLPADDLRPMRPVDANRPGGDLRADPHGGTVHH